MAKKEIFLIIYYHRSYYLIDILKILCLKYLLYYSLFSCYILQPFIFLQAHAFHHEVVLQMIVHREVLQMIVHHEVVLQGHLFHFHFQMVNLVFLHVLFYLHLEEVDFHLFQHYYLNYNPFYLIS